PPAARGAEAARRLGEEARRPFALARGPLLRAALLRLDEEEHTALFVLHHIVSDGWSTGLLAEEVSALYTAIARGEPSPLAPLPVQYADHAVWQRAWLAGGVLDAQLAWWRERLAGAPALLELPTDRPRPAVQGDRGDWRRWELAPATAAGLRALAREEGATLFMVVAAAWQLLLSRYAGQDEVLVGTPVAGRTRVETERLIGFFVNTLVLRTDLSGDPSFRALLGRVREATLGAHQHQDVPFERLVEELQPERSTRHTPFFQTMLSLHTGARRELRLGPVAAEPVAADAQAAKFDLTLEAAADGEGLGGTLVFRTELWDAPTVERMAGHLRTLLEAIVARPDRPVTAVALLGRAERRQVEEWSTSGAAAADRRPVHALFAEQAERTPGSVALVYGDVSLTYAELHHRSSRLASLLAERGVRPGTRVCVCAERSPELVVALLGILKAGGAYVPLDPQYPAERLAFMLADARGPVLVTQESVRGRLPEFAGALVSLDGDAAGIAGQGGEAPAVEVSADDLAYVIYTSGSTGLPKGTEVPHRAIPGFFRGVDYARFDEGTVLLQHSSVSWDALTLELWPALLSGGRCVLYSGAAAEPALLGEQVREHGVDTLWLTAAYFNLVVDTCPEILRGVAQVMTGGEAVSVPHVRRALELYPGLRLVNGYGPSECTVFASCYVVPAGFDGSVVPIGRPVGDRRVHLLDRAWEPVPVGVPGELCIGGAAVARGYLGRPELTAEKFVPDPFGEPGARLYRSGDRVRWRADGVLEFVGRADFQVKIRGFRVEPGEVEAALAAHPQVREAAVAVREASPGERRLVGYVTAEAGQTLPGGELRAWLGERLPEYMVPAAVVVLGTMPLTAHGKVDRRALPEVELAAGAQGRVAPRTPTEEVLAGIYAAALGVEGVGAADDFFALGGHSLLATRAVSRVREAFGVELPMRALFEAPTVAGLAARVDALLREDGGTPAPPLLPVPRDGRPLPLSFAQQRLWFIDRLAPGSAAYNIPSALRLRGRLDVAALRAAVGGVVRRHEALRTVFADVGGEPVQVVGAPRAVPVPLADLRGLGAEERSAELRRLAREESLRPFDLAAGPVLRCALVRVDEEEHALLFTLHHVAGDAWSMELLTGEVAALYDASSRGEPSPLPPLPVQYADYAVWQRAWLSGDVLERQLGWWRGRLAGAPPNLDLPTDRPRT
ncbi:MAG TPA: amino acid adenylation domain-containing protein, partial [Longimicrobiaceae bacterium]|nr:amino acid adenylation domain-containing protein [Longimicrobiaceae bacterium]